jgi:pyruvate/oxaloacetate carboxyltransferase
MVIIHFRYKNDTEQIKDVLPDILDVGYFGLEVWGGATLDSAMRYLKKTMGKIAIISEYN